MLVYPRRPAIAPGPERNYAVPRGATPARVAADLGVLGVVETPWLFSVYLSLRGAPGDFREDEVAVLRAGMTPRELASALARGLGARTLRVTLPEGLDREQVVERLVGAGVADARSLRRAMEDPTLREEFGITAGSVEGHLQPDTYDFREGEPAREVVRRLLATRRERLDVLFAQHEDAVLRLREEFGFGRDEVIVLASIVEEEAAVADERPRIAGVFFNRLRSTTFLPARRLQSDPTVSYGCRFERASSPSCAGFAGTITRAMLEDATNRYNTYRHAGLPPGPICSPGLASIEAVLAPEQHRFLYFVARGGRRHAFSETLEEHNAAVAAARASGALP